MLRLQGVRMRPIRTIMVTVSPLLKDLVLQAVAGQAALHVVSVLESRRGLYKRLPETDAELVLIALRPDEDDAVAAELARLLPKARIVALSYDMKRLWLHKPGGYRRMIADASTRTLVMAIRGDIDRSSAEM